MTRAMYRGNRMTRFTRIMSTILAVVFTLSFTGGVFAVSPAPTTSGAPATEAPAVEHGAPSADASAPVEAAPAPEAPAPEAAPEAAPAPAPAPVKKDAAATKISARKGLSKQRAVLPKDAPVDVKAAPAPAAPMAAAAGGGSIGIVAFEGYNESQGKWTTGNLGSYDEGEWVQYRLILENTSGSPKSISALTFGLDHYDASPNEAIMFDKTQGWGYFYPGSKPGSGDARYPALFDTLSPNPKDAGKDTKTAPVLVSTVGDGAFTVPANGYAAVWFEGHLAMTVIQQLKWQIDGAGSYPGSSGHGYLEMAGVGKRTLPLPSVPVPGGQIDAIKFYDTGANPNGIRDPGEDQLLNGWTMHLSGSADDFDVDVSKVTGAGGVTGVASFGPLPPGTYLVTEDLQAGWGSNTKQPVSVTLVDGETKPAEIGNYHKTVAKTFALTVDSVVDGVTSYIVEYKADGQPQSLELTDPDHDNVYTATKSFTYGTVISGWTFYAVTATEKIALGPTGGSETLTHAITNPLTFTPIEITGYKYIDEDRDGAYPDDDDKPGAGWTIELYRGSKLVGSTTTKADGSYYFGGLLPGTYTIKEVQDSSYTLVYPASGEHVTDPLGSGDSWCADFVNKPKLAGIDIVKTGPAVAHAGDEITYTFTVTNNGALPLKNVVVSDPLFDPDLSILIGDLAVGQSVVKTAKYTIPAGSPDPLNNTATATGTSTFGPVADMDDHSVDLIDPKIDVTKVADPDMVVDSGTVTYKIVVTNPSTDTTLYGVDVIDYVGGEVRKTLATDITLEPGESKTYTFTETVSAPVTDTVKVNGADELGKTVTDEASATVNVKVTKTFQLTLSAAVMGATGYKVAWKIGGVETLADLIPTANPLVFKVSATPPYGTKIDSWRLFAVVGGADVALTGDLPGETLTGPKTNAASYTAKISGTKKIDTDRDGKPDDVGAGWVIELRKDDKVIATTTTLADGSYSFEGLVPGSYTLTEQGRFGYEQLSGPDVFSIPLGGKTITGLDFVNQKLSYSLDLTKSGPDLAHAGDTITYTFTVENTGDLPLNDVTVSDPLFDPDLSINAGTLQPGSTYTTSVPYTIPADAPDPLPNTATAVGTSVFGPTSDVDSHEVDLIKPVIDVTKNADPTAVVDSGLVTYTITVTNPSTDTTLYGVDVIDYVGDQVRKTLATDITLEPGESKTYTFSETVTAPVTDTVKADGVDALGKPVKDQASASVTVQITKTFELKLAEAVIGADKFQVDYTIDNETITHDLVADGLTYRYTALFDWGTTISSYQYYAVFGATRVAITPVLAGEQLVEGPYKNMGEYTPTDISGTKRLDMDRDGTPEGLGEGWVIELRRSGNVIATTTTAADGSYSFKGLLPGSYTLTEQLKPYYEQMSGPAPFTVPSEAPLNALDFVNAPLPAHITVVKSVAPAEGYPGDPVTWTIVVTNDGQQPLDHVTINDALLGISNLDIGSLAVGESHTMTIPDWKIPLDARDQITNVATAEGTPPVGPKVTGTDDAVVTVLRPDVTKKFRLETAATLIPQPDGIFAEWMIDGQTSTAPLANKGGGVWESEGVILPWGTTIQSWSIYAMVGNVKIVLFEGESETLDPRGDEPLEIVNTGKFTPGTREGVKQLDLNRDGVADEQPDPTYLPGWKFDLTGGPAEGEDVLAADGVLASAVSEADGSYSFTGLLPGTYTVTEDMSAEQAKLFTLIAPEGGSTQVTVEPGATAQIAPFVNQPVPPAIQIEKSAEIISVDTGEPVETGIPGDTIIYTFTVTNTGPWTLDPVTVTDPMLPEVADVDIPALAPGESFTFELEFTVEQDTPAGEFTNVATATGTDKFGKEVTDTDDATVTIEEPLPGDPDMVVEKKADKTVAAPGDTITYTVTYKNVGTGNAVDFTVVDDFPQQYVTITDAAGGTVADGKITWKIAGPLAPGKSGSITYKAKVNSDVAGGTKVKNVVTIPEYDTSDDWTVTIEEFLPFTGANVTILILLAALAIALGLALRRIGRTAS